MLIESITLRNFQSIGNEPVTIPLASDLTAFVGGNGAGKTAVLTALQRMFGTSSGQRQVKKSDFHLPPGKELSEISHPKLMVEVKIVFPELGSEDDDSAIPPCFKHMKIAGGGEPPYCIVRLEAKWEDDTTVEGAIDQGLFWGPIGENPVPMTASDRGLIQVHYIPATRNGGELVEQHTRLMKKRLFRAIQWTENFEEVVSESAEKIATSLKNETAVSTINQLLKDKWGQLNGSRLLADPELTLLSSSINDIANDITVGLSPTEDGGVRSIRELSDGQTSLFYFALTAAVFEIERQVSKSCTVSSDSGFCEEHMRAPALTIFAIEEPENHLSPYYLCRVLDAAKDVSKYPVSQSIVTSHSSSTLSRVDPESVRHFRLCPEYRTTVVNSIRFPDDDVEAAKFMRGAVIAFPELYFAKCVVLCEGDSERIVVPKVAKALGVDLDPSFVAVVPLGGRHVNYFWRLLESLKIPYVTLVDLDLGRCVGGWSRLKNLAEKMLEFGVDKNSFKDFDKNSFIVDHWLEPEHLVGVEYMREGVHYLRGKGVFCSWPLDIDMSMLAAFPAAYRKLSGAAAGPRLSEEEAISPVLKKRGVPQWYDHDDLRKYKKLFPCYNYLFLGKSKPVSHVRALAGLTDEDIAANCPDELRELVNEVCTLIKEY